jgi:hypothetical protein
MDIIYVGHSVVSTQTKYLNPNNVLHVPKAKKILFRFIDSLVTTMLTLNFIPISFMSKIKERGNSSSKKMQERPLSALAGIGARSSNNGCYSKSYQQKYLPCSSEMSNEIVCDACQKSRSLQLPYKRSSTISSVSLEPMFSDV